MAIRTYHDFIIFTDDVETGRDGKVKSFSVRVFDSPEGQGEVKERVVVPQSPDLERWSRRLGERRLDTEVEQQMDLGARLADLLLPPDARRLYQRSLARLHQDEGLRLRLRLADRLLVLPWEYMLVEDADGERTPSGFLALDPRISIVRHEAIAVRAEWFEAAEKRRILVVMATPQPYADYPRLKNLPGEQKLMRDVLGSVPGIDVTCVPEYNGIGDRPTPGATVEDVRGALLESSTDIFHFSGHGEFVERMGPLVDTIEGEGAIVLADEHNRAVSVPGDRLAEILRGKGVRLVVMGCCEAAKRDIFHKWSSVAASLLKGRISSVVAMQFTIQDDLAAAFMVAFYQALVAGLTIDEAVALGRGAIRAKALGERTHVRDWGAPVLYLRAPGGRIFDPVTDKEASVEARQKSEQRFRLNQAWWEWMAHDVAPSTDQLQHLSETSETLELSPVQTLLLVRSALAVDAPVGPWLARLRRDGGDYLKELDDPRPLAAADLAEAQEILRLDQDVLSDRPEHVGPVAWCAVGHDDVITRQTAALALTALEPVPHEGLDRLKQALGGRDGYSSRWWRQGELYGTLADADPEIGKLNARRLSPPDRAGVWLWRVRRRVIRDRQRIVWLTLGGALGAGLPLALLRGVAALFAPDLASNMPVISFSTSLNLGAILGGAIALGMSLAEPLLLEQRGEGAKTARLRQRLLGTDHLPAVLGAAMGALFFGMADVIAALLNGLPLLSRPITVLTGCLAGVGLSVGLYGQPRVGWRLGVGRWLLRVGAAGLTMALAQLVVFRAGHLWLATAISEKGSFYVNNYGVPAPYETLAALLDAAVVGIVLTIGITLGLSAGVRCLTRWRSLVGPA